LAGATMASTSTTFVLAVGSFLVGALMIAYMPTMMVKTYTHLIAAPAMPSEQRERTTR
jgi:hypothetical protein